MVIAGQGTVGREIAEDMAALGLKPDIVIAPVSGGGLIAGVATAIKARYPQAMVMSAEPQVLTIMRLAAIGKTRAARAEGRTSRCTDGVDPRRNHSRSIPAAHAGVTASDAEVRWRSIAFEN